MTRKETPDILGALMGKEIKSETNKEIKEPSNKAINTASSIEISAKEKATFNLSKSMLGKLEDCWIEIRKIRKDKKISKTDIVEHSIQEFIKEFQDKKDASKLYRSLARNKEIKQ